MTASLLDVFKTSISKLGLSSDNSEVDGVEAGEGQEGEKCIYMMLMSGRNQYTVVIILHLQIDKSNKQLFLMTTNYCKKTSLRINYERLESAVLIRRHIYYVARARNTSKMKLK